MTATRRPSIALLAACLTTAWGLGGCGSGGGGGSPQPASAENRTAYLVEQLQDWYLWNDRLPAVIDPKAYADEESALDALRVAEDRYSHIEDAEAYARFYGEGRTVAFGILYRVRDDDLLLMMVQPSSPAAAAGLRRGQRILAIDGVTITALLAAGSLDAAFGPAETDVTRTFTVDDAGSVRDIVVTKTLFDLDYVLAEAVFERAGRRIGYLSLYSFGAPAVNAWRESVDRLLADGAQDLVVDLRTNGGGLLSTTATIGSALGALDGRPMTRLTFNDAHSGSDRTIQFSDDPRGPRVDRLVWLTSGQTCSASEALILGLEPWRSATRIGTTTCGKPVGFTPTTFDGRVFNLVTFSLSNAVGTTGYYDGLPPGCEVVDDARGQFGEAGETLTAAALQWLADGTCAAPAAGSGAKAAGPPAPERAWRPPFTSLR